MTPTDGDLPPEFWPVPADPGAAAWRATADAIARRCRQEQRTQQRRHALAAASFLGLMGLAVWAANRTPTVVPPRADADAPPVAVAEAEGFELAAAGEVVVEAVRGGDGTPWLVGVESPVPEAFAWAGPQDVTIERVKPASGGRTPRMTDRPGESPMIFAAAR